MTNYKKILVAIDIHAQYEQVINKALTICNSKDDLNLVYVPLPITYISPYLYGVDYSDIDDSERVNKSHEELKSIGRKFGIDESRVHFKVGEAADEIQNIANEIHADLIVIGTHGRSGLKLLLGSTANSVLHGVKQDVLAVRIKE
uniref:universal stress protein n=1 Tax=Ningiella ruwaisensis TaxID=2364274 RepID=UPI00109EF3F1|nr:universal stress protein [Ningiella ruwaisensis]